MKTSAWPALHSSYVSIACSPKFSSLQIFYFRYGSSSPVILGLSGGIFLPPTGLPGGFTPGTPVSTQPFLSLFRKV